MTAHVQPPRAPVPGESSRSAEPAGLVPLVARLSMARSLEELMSIVTEGVRNLLKADGATFVLRDNDRCFYAEEDAVSPLWKGQRFPLKACISGWCMLHGEATAVPDIEADSRIPIAAYRPTFVRSLAMAPVRKNAPIAALGAYWSQVREISVEELELLQAIADSAALAVAYVQLQRITGRAPAIQAVKPQATPRARAPLSGALARLRRDGIPPNSAAAYACAAMAVGVATLARLAVGGLGVAGLSSFVTYYPAVLVAVLVGGPAAGLLAAGLGAVLAQWAFQSQGVGLVDMNPGHILNIGLFLGANGLMIWMLDRYRRAVSRLTEEDARRVSLAREVQHRVRNMVSVAQAIVTQSLRGDPAQARTINQRIRAGVSELALTDHGADDVRSVREALTAELEPFDLSRFELVGEEDAPLAASLRSTLALTIHELATNAAKYGALSTPGGRVRISWRLNGLRRAITWAETGGPPVAKPERRGYGTVFLRRLLEASGGSIASEFRPQGLSAEISLPLDPRHRQRA